MNLRDEILKQLREALGEPDAKRIVVEEVETDYNDGATRRVIIVLTPKREPTPEEREIAALKKRIEELEGEIRKERNRSILDELERLRRDRERTHPYPWGDPPYTLPIRPMLDMPERMPRIGDLRWSHRTDAGGWV